jgi:hypothetical protein
MMLEKPLAGLSVSSLLRAFLTASALDKTFLIPLTIVSLYKKEPLDAALALWF